MSLRCKERLSYIFCTMYTVYRSASPVIHYTYFVVYDFHFQKNYNNLFFFYRIIAYFAVGALFTTLTTELAKHRVGRLRPYFLYVCKPDLTDELCLDSNGYQKFVTFDETGTGTEHCTGTAEEFGEHDYEKLIREARKSFLSGHSSFSFYCASFIIMYLHSRLSSDARQGLEPKRCFN